MMMLASGEFNQPIAEAATLQAFFDTVACRLESTLRGSRYPLLMDQLHDGRLSSRDATPALAELSAIRSGLSGLTTAQILPPRPSSAGTGNAEVFFSALMAQLAAALESSAASGQPLYLNDVTARRAESRTAVLLFLGGLAWCLVIHTLFAHWYLVPAMTSDSRVGFPIWRAGFFPIAISFPYLVSSASPPLRYWFLRRQWLVVTLGVGGAGVLAALSIMKFQ